MLRVSKILYAKNIPVDPELAEAAYQTILHQLKSIPSYQHLSQNVWAWELGKMAESVSPGILEKCGLPRLQLILSVDNKEEHPRLLGSLGVNTGALRISLFGIKNKTLALNKNLHEDIRTTVLHELSHLYQASYQGGDAYRKRLDTKDMSKIDFLNDNYEYKAVSSELCLLFKEFLVKHPNTTSCDEAVRAFFSSYRIMKLYKQYMNERTLNAIKKDLAHIYSTRS